MLGKRKRASSEPLPSSPHHRRPHTPTPPLTTENLAAHDEMTSPTKNARKKLTLDDVSAASSSARSAMSHAACIDLYHQHNMRIDARQSKPHNLEALLEQLEETERKEISPNAKTIVRLAPAVAEMAESTAVAHIDQYLGLQSAFDGGIEGVSIHRQENLQRAWLPDTVGGPVHSPHSVPTPQPDSLSGFMSCRQANKGALKSMFTAEEERAVKQYQVINSALFPLFTAQYKSASKGGTIQEARDQGARDGAPIVRALHAMFEQAGTDISVVDSCHVSVVSDMNVVQPFVHWRNVTPTGQVYWDMDRITRCFDMQDLEDMQRYRKILRNWVDHVFNVRLPKIRSAIQRIQSQQLVTQNPVAVPPALSLGSTRSASTADRVPTPSVVAPGSPLPLQRKRARMDDVTVAGAETA